MVTRLAIPALTLLVALVIPAGASANPLDLLGVSPRSRGMGHAVTAFPTGGDAAYFSPALAAMESGFSLGVDYGLAYYDLRINGERLDAYTSRGLGITLSVPVRLHPNWSTGFVTAVHLPSVGVARILLTPATQPRFTLLDDRANRAAVYVGLGAAFRRMFAVGVGMHLLAKTVSQVTLTIGGNGEISGVPTGGIEARLANRAAPTFSAAWRPNKSWSFAVTYRSAIDLPLEIDIAADVNVVGVAVGSAEIELRAIDLYTPSQLAIGGAWRWSGATTLLVALDLTWVRWSGLTSLFADLSLDLALSTAPPIVKVSVPSPAMHDTLEARLGAEWSGRFAESESRWALRLGYGLLPSPVPDQVGLTSIADSTRHAVSIGVGFDLAELYPLLYRPLSLDLSFGAQVLQRRRAERERGAPPFGSFEQSGVIWHGSAGVTVRF